MRFSALLLSLVIALGLAGSLEAKTKHKTPKVHHSSSRKTPKAPRVKHKPAKIKPMKFRKPKHSARVHTPKPPKARKVKNH
jgi:hypothetical protein